MAKLITKFKYLKPSDRQSVGGYAKYIATREGVEKIDDTFKNDPPTEKQKKLIDKILHDFPDSKDMLEYEDYLKEPTLGNASEFINRVLEDNAHIAAGVKTYADYIATRPRAERFGSHGLFTDDGVRVKLEDVSKELNEYDGNVWTVIISLRREDAERLGFNLGERWRDMLRTQTEAIAKNFKIPVEDLKWYAAFHNESHHPHVHLMVYSSEQAKPYLTQKGIMNLRSAFAKDIFADDLLSVYEKQTEHRNALRSQSRDVIGEIVSRINSGTYDNPAVENKLLELAERLTKTSGKKQYGYLKADIKAIVNGIVSELANDKRIAALYNLPFQYKRFLGYRRGSDGKPEIDPEQAVVVKRIYERFLAGDSLATIANDLNADGIPTPSGNGQWQRGTIASILTNEKYKGDAILNKTYIRDCLSKKVMINNGERPKYYVENNHPAIIDSAAFGRVQEEMARRCGKRKVKQVGTKTEQGRYSSKYALTELLICGECGTPYRRCTWAANGKKKIVWRCISRLDYGKKYCHNSPSIEESVLQEAIMKAVLQTAKQNAEVLKTLKLHIGMGLYADATEDNSLDLQIKIAEIEAEFQKMLKAVAADNVEAFDEEKAKALMDEKAKLQIQLDRIADTKQKRENAKSRLDEIFVILEALANHPISYDDQIVRQILESVVVESKDRIKVVFVGGLEVTQML